MSIELFMVFILAWLLVVCTIGWALDREQFQKQNLKYIIFALCFMSAFGPLGEIFVDAVYQAAFGHALWRYELYPVHGGATSLIAPLIWGISGIEMYSITTVMRKKSFGRIRRACILAVDILIAEVLLNVSYWLLSGSYLFYYLPNDLLHFSSIQTIPFYMVAALVIMRAFRNFSAHPRFSAVFFVMTAFIIVYLA